MCRKINAIRSKLRAEKYLSKDNPTSKKDPEPNERNDFLQPETIAKEPYRKPEFKFESVFEVSAVSCGKISATSQSCIQNRKLS
jgi:hypothetical protein